MVPSLLHCINDIERIGDHAVNIAELAERKIDFGLKFSKMADDEIKKVDFITKEMIDDAIKALPDLNKNLAKNIINKENKLNSLVVEYRTTHTERLGKGICKHISGIVFIDLLMNFEKIGDHLTNIAQAIQGRLQWNSDDV